MEEGDDAEDASDDEESDSDEEEVEPWMLTI